MSINKQKENMIAFSNKFGEDKDYWIKKLSGCLDISSFPFSCCSPNLSQELESETRFYLSTEVSNRIQHMSGKSEYAAFIILLSGIIYLLHRYTDENGIVVGIPPFKVSNETEPINILLPLRSFVHDEKEYKDFLGEVKKDVMDANKHRNFPVTKVLEILNEKNEFDKQMSYKTVVTFNNVHNIETEKHMDGELFFNFEVINEVFACNIRYKSNLYDKGYIEGIFKHMSNFYDSITINPNITLSQIEIMSKCEINNILNEFNNTKIYYPNDKIIHELFEEQVEKTPDNIAAIFEDKQLTYKELNGKSNQVARKLRESGINSNSIVGIMLERSLEMIIGIYGILKAGAAYLPIDLEYPKERINYILKDSNSRILLSKEKYFYKIDFENIHIIDLDNERLYIGDTSNLDNINTPKDLAYIIYTSGSTGNPKGVMIEHHSVINRLVWMQKKYPINSNDVILQKTPFTFDVSVWELFWWSFYGAKVCLANSGDEKDPNVIFNLIHKYKVTVMHFVPSMLEMFLNCLEEKDDLMSISSLRKVFASGESLGFKQVKRFNTLLAKNYNIGLINLYGPTEATVDVTYYDCSSESDLQVIPIGKPIDNINIYITNKNNKIQPIEVPGELCISGVGVARGYLNRSQLTGEKFINNPYDNGTIMYKTGDFARWRSDGNIEYLGRMDSQVKIRGCRIELGEIEKVLLEYPGIEQAIVAVEQDERQDKALVGYLVTNESRNKIKSDELVYKLPNNMSIYHLNKNETEFMYKEIFENQGYLKHGITIQDGDCILDVGANIGMFSLFANVLYKDVQVYAFEPMPPVFRILEHNATTYCSNTKVFNIGLSNERGEATFTYYPKASIMSGRYANENIDKEVFLQSISNVSEMDEYEREIINTHSKELLEGRFESQKYKCKIKTISQVIMECNIKNIDLLKIDVEKSEIDILEGIQYEDWNKIKQIVVEVHDTDGQVDEITTFLEGKGYIVYVDADSSLKNAKLCNIYAISQQYYRCKETCEEIGADKILEIPIVKDKIFSVEELVTYLEEKLPSYMIPSYFIEMDNMPLTSNGKIDKKLLPKLDKSKVNTKKYTEPRNDLDKKIKHIWLDILGITDIGIEDNLFQVGGHSLKAIMLASKLGKELNVGVSVRDIFDRPTIKEIADYISISEKKEYKSISAVEEREYYPMSPAEKRMFILNQIEKNGTEYNIPLAMRIEGKLDKDKFQEALQTLLRRHEILRTSFSVVNGEPMQKVNKDVELNIVHYTAEEHEIKKIINQFVEPFNLEQAPLMRAALIEISEENHIFLLDIHHIIFDGTSNSIFMQELSDLYMGEELPDLKVQYKDYSVWQNNLIKEGYIKKEEEYWLSTFDGEIPVLNLPTDYPRPTIQSFEGDNVTIVLNKELTNNLKRIATETGSTMYMVLLSVINILLSKYSGQEDIIIGTPIAGKQHPDLEKVIGMFVNTLAMRNRPERNKTYGEFLKEVRENSLRAYENQNYQFEELVDKLNLRRDLSRNPLFDIMFVMDNLEYTNEELIRGLKLKQYNYGYNVAKFDLSFSAVENKEELRVGVEYCTKLFKKETIDRMGEHLKNILKIVTEDTNVRLGDIDMITDEEREKILKDFNNTYTEYPENKAIHELFEEQVEETPDNIAVVFEDSQLTYRELNEKANKLARTLRENGVKSDSIVGILVERSLDMIIGIMGILKAGGAYLPIDPEYPQDRIRYMLEDSKASLLLTQVKFINEELFVGEVINLQDEKMYTGKGENLDSISTSRNLAYVIYTSGSTGKPKGVMIENASINNYLCLLIDEYNNEFGPEDRCLSLTNVVFDVSVLEIFIPLIRGASLVINNRHRTFEINEIAKLIINERITFTYIPPSLLIDVYEALETLQDKIKLNKLLVGVEPIKDEVLEKYLDINENMQIVNWYGPTEATIAATCYKFTKQRSKNRIVPIGKPVKNTQIYILDQNRNLQPIGVPGEIYISGKGLARGYLNNKETTAEKFIENPFVFGEKMYKTGDLGKWLLDGNIEFLKRTDHQVKIRGFRIELGEIEEQLLNHNEIKEAIVIDKEDGNGTKYLCAYLVFNNEVKVAELRRYLLRNLPEYMIPSYFVQLDKLPLNPNGKIDRKELPEPNKDAMKEDEYEAPRNEIEERLVAIWSEVLNVDGIGIKDNFFQIGGHSLKAIILVSKVSKMFNIEMLVTEVFDRPTIMELAEYVSSSENKEYLSIKSVEEREYYPVSAAEKRIFILNQIEGSGVGYNIPLAMRIEGILDKKRFQEALQILINRHESLRTSFYIMDREPVQKVNKDVELSIVHCKAEEQEVKNIIDKFIRPFDLSQAPLIRAGLIEISKENHIFLFDIHHIIFDGISMSVFMKELSSLYAGEELPELKIQYKDYSVWQNNIIQKGYIKKQEQYWLNTFQGEIPVLDLPLDYSRPVIQSIEGDNVTLKLSKELTNKLKGIAVETDSTMYMVILSGINVLLSQYSNQEDIVIGTPVAGRQHADLENVIGMFVNTLPMRNYPQGIKNYEEFLKEVRQNALKAFENQQYPFEELVDKLNIKRNISRNPLFDVMFMMESFDEMANEPSYKLKFGEYNYGYKIAKFDLTFSARQMGEELFIDLQYCTKLFKRETVERMGRHLKNIFKAIAENKKIALSEMEIFSIDEKRKLIHEFNNTYAEYPKNRTIHELFEEQVEKTPEQVAVIFEEKKLTYRELNEKANKLARSLREKGVKPDSIVGIMVERSLEMVIGIMGILKAGGAYLPIDPQYPEERIKYMLEDSKTEILLTQSKFIEKSNFHREILNLEDKGIYIGEGENLGKINSPKDLAYVIYTSGSTGKPKGVMIENYSVINRLNWMQKKYSLGKEDVILQKTTYTFDVSVWELIWWSLVGATVCMLSPGKEKDPKYIIQAIEKNQITTIHFVPSMFNVFMEWIIGMGELDRIKTLKWIFTSGEVLGLHQVETFKKEININNKIKLVNLYGPTEATIDVTYFNCMEERDRKVIPIGRPIDNIRAYIIDKNRKLQLLGLPGELCIGGDGLARGYLGKLELTAEKFIENPYVPGEIIYRTGDLARWLPDGNIEFLGRIDQQVKIRGFRIELGEIESQLLKYQGIKEAVVVDKEDKTGVKYLCAYIVAEKQLIVKELVEHLAKSLPDYMIPAHFILLEKIPLTLNGKVDRRMLPEPNENIATEEQYKGPTNRVEEKLVLIWSEILGIEQVGINDNFFELGGHSLRAIQVLNLIHKKFNIRINLSDLFKSPTITGLSNLIQNNRVYAYDEIERLEPKEQYEVSYAQRRLWIINQLEPDSIAYNMPFTIALLERVERDIIETIFNELIFRHEALRTRFKIIDGEPMQVIDDRIEFKLNYIDLSNLSDEKKRKERKKVFMQLATRVFNLNLSPLIFIDLVKIEEQAFDLNICMHHIISDGWSIELLKREFTILYNMHKKGERLKLPELSIQYKDFAAWQNKLLLNEERVKDAKDYWSNQLKEEPPVLELPIKHSIRKLEHRGSAGYRFVISENLKNKLKTFSKENNTSVFISMLTILNFFLTDLTGQKDILIATPAAGRKHADLTNVIGYFINTTILRNQVEMEATFTQLLGRVNENTLNALQYQDYPIELLLDELGINYPKVSVFFNMLNMADSDKNYIENFESYHIQEMQDVKFDMVWYVVECSNGIEIVCSYLSELFDTATIQYIVERYVRTLEVILENPNKLLKEYNMNKKKRKI